MRFYADDTTFHVTIPELGLSWIQADVVRLLLLTHASISKEAGFSLSLSLSSLSVSLIRLLGGFRPNVVGRLGRRADLAREAHPGM